MPPSWCRLENPAPMAVSQPTLMMFSVVVVTSECAMEKGYSSIPIIGTELPNRPDLMPSRVMWLDMVAPGLA